VSRQLFRLHPALATLLAAMFVTSSPAGNANSPDPVDRPSQSTWMGAFWGIELKTGLSLRAKDGADGELDPQPSFGLGLRVATLVSLIDLELFGVVTPLADRYTRTAVGLDLRLHPLFIRMLQRDFGSRVLAGLHLSLGAGADVLSAETASTPREGIESSTHVAFAFAFGLGVDIPLTHPSRNDPSLWLGLGWRMRFVGFSDAPAGLRDMDEHVVLVQLGLRFHDIGFMRVPKPPELDDRDR